MKLKALLPIVVLVSSPAAQAVSPPMPYIIKDSFSNRYMEPNVDNLITGTSLATPPRDSQIWEVTLVNKNADGSELIWMRNYHSGTCLTPSRTAGGINLVGLTGCPAPSYDWLWTRVQKFNGYHLRPYRESDLCATQFWQVEGGGFVLAPCANATETVPFTVTFASTNYPE